MAALYTHTTRASGTVLTATIYNGDHQNHIDNGVPLQHDDYSVNVTQMQTVTDPGEVSSESLATTQAGEFERLRFAIKEAKQAGGGTVAQWYSTPTATASLKAPVAKVATFNIANTDKGVIFDATGTYSVTFNALSTFDADFNVTVINTGTGTITLDANASEVIEGPGGADGGDLTYPLPFAGSTTGPYNITGVTLYKKSSTSWGVLTTRETHGKQLFTGGGTWTCPEGVHTAWVTAQGGGGGGGGIAANTQSGAGGGAAGGGVLKSLVSPIPGTAYTVTIGAGGAGGVGSGTGNGASGGTTSLGALISIGGGVGAVIGAANSVSAGGAGGAFQDSGTDGILADLAGTQKNYACGGAGGGGMFGGASRSSAVVGGGSVGGSAGNSAGSGGGGAASTNAAGVAVNGGAGANGFLLVEW